MPKPSLQLHCASQTVCAVVVDCVQLGMFDVSMRAAKPAFFGMQHRQGGMNAGQQIELIDRRCDSRGYPEMVNSLLCIALGTIHLAKNMMTSTDQELFASLWEEIDHAGRSVEPPVDAQGPSEREKHRAVDPPRNSFASRTPSLLRRINECAPDRCTGAEASL